MLQLSQGEHGLLNEYQFKLYLEECFMAFYVMLIKVNEDEQGVTYNFGSDSEHLGKIHLDKHGLLDF